MQILQRHDDRAVLGQAAEQGSNDLERPVLQSLGR